MKPHDLKKYGRIDSGRGKVRRRLILAAGALCLLLWSCWNYLDTYASVKDRVLSYPPQIDTVIRRYVLFTMPIESGEWPALFSTKDRLNWATKQNEASVPTQVFSNLPRRVAQVETIPSSDFIMAIATDSTHIMADDFPPKSYLRGTDTTLLLVLGPLDPQETETVQKHLTQHGVKAYVIKVPADDLETRKFELLGSLFEFQKYAQGTAKYYTILDHDVQIPSLSSFQNLIAQYNSIENHLIVDESFKSDTSYTPITITAAFLGRMFDGDETWNRCVKATKSDTTAVAKISRCVGIMQGSVLEKAKFDGESLTMREVDGSALGLMESGHQPLSLRPYRVHGSPSFNTDLFQNLVAGQGIINASELMARYAFWEDDQIKWVYTHGCSMANYPKGISDKQLKAAEVTWTRGPDEIPAHDAPYYRGLASDDFKTSYLLHSITPYSVRHGKSTLDWQSILYRSESGDYVQVDWVTNQLL